MYVYVIYITLVLSGALDAHKYDTACLHLSIQCPSVSLALKKPTKNKNTSRPWLILNWLNKSLILELTNAFKHLQCLQKQTK